MNPHECLCCDKIMQIQYVWCEDCEVKYRGNMTFHCPGHNQETTVQFILGGVGLWDREKVTK